MNESSSFSPHGESSASEVSPGTSFGKPEGSRQSVVETRSSTATPFTMTVDVVLDANVLVGLLDPADSLHARSTAFLQSLSETGKRMVLLDFIVDEAISVLCRRAQQRKLSTPPNLEAAEKVIQEWQEKGLIQATHEHLLSAESAVRSIAFRSGGVLNVNDARLVYLQRCGAIGQFASFDQKLAAVPDIACVVPQSS